MVEPLEGLVLVLHFEVMAESDWGGKSQIRSCLGWQLPKLQMERASSMVQSGQKRGEQGGPPQSG